MSKLSVGDMVRYHFHDEPVGSPRGSDAIVFPSPIGRVLGVFHTKNGMLYRVEWDGGTVDIENANCLHRLDAVESISLLDGPAPAKAEDWRPVCGPTEMLEQDTDL